MKNCDIQLVNPGNQESAKELVNPKQSPGKLMDPKFSYSRDKSSKFSKEVAGLKSIVSVARKLG